LKAGVWFRRGRRFMVSPVHGDYRRCQAETPLSDLFKFAEPALSNLLQIISPEGETMTKVQDLREQATRAERLASSILDTVTVERLLAFAADCRKQLGVLSEPKEA
jgi:hypothetical protein